MSSTLRWTPSDHDGHSSDNRFPHHKVASGGPNPAKAMAQAVRQQLTRPGSVPHQRQLELVLADRDTVPDGSAPKPPATGWSPFSTSADASPYRPLEAASWLASPETAGNDPQIEAHTPLS